jgi:imidazolonepropionase-like amidohydrolase
MYAARNAGIPISETQALQWITKHPAWVLGIEQDTGTLEAGKMADVVVWSRSPLSVYALAEKVFIDGRQVFDRAQGSRARKSDFELGQSPEVP